MYLAYFDENKYSQQSPLFYIGGILLPDRSVCDLESELSEIQYNFFGTTILTKDTEMHGKDLFHGKGAFKKRPLANRMRLLEQLAVFLTTHRIAVRLICIDVSAHRSRYRYPQPEYQLGLMLILERFCDYLEKQQDVGVVFGDYEKDEITRAVLDFSQFKLSGRTPMYKGRPLGRLVDTIYFTHSHHSRFLQVADIVVFLANRFESIADKPLKWHEAKAWGIWQTIRTGTDFEMQRWP